MESSESLRRSRGWVAGLGLAAALVGCSEDPQVTDAARDGAALDTTPGDDAQGFDVGSEVMYQSLDGGDSGTPPGDVVAPRDVGVDVRPDVPRTDGGFVGGASQCTGSTYTVCEDFESGSWGSVWTPHATNGTQVVDATHVARGSHALHIHTMTAAGGTGANVGLTTTHGFPAGSNTYWGRAFVYLAASVAPTTHTTLFASGGSLTTGGTTFSVSQRYSISGGKLDASYDTSPRPPTTDYAHRSATNMPLNRWACLEWEFKGSTNEVHYYLDDTELTDMAVLPSATPTWTAPTWTNVQVGLQLYQPDAVNSFDMWLDEVAINTSRIRCEN